MRVHAQGVIRKDGTGYATFNVEYRALVTRPYKGEVLDTLVTSINKVWPPAYTSIPHHTALCPTPALALTEAAMRRSSADGLFC